MKNFLIALFVLLGAGVFAQDVDGILQKYFETTGGVENWKNMQSLRTVGVMKMQGMEIPFDGYQAKDGKMLQKANFQGKEVIFLASDGETAWGVNFMTMKPEKKDNETVENLRKQAKDFPSPFVNYKEKNFKVSLEGEKEIEGTPTYRIKLEKDSILADGKMFPNIEYYYFDKENFVPIMKEAAIPMGPMAGQKAQTYFGDYRESGDFIFPFEMTTKINGNIGQSMVMEKYEVNPEFDESVLKFPEEAEGGDMPSDNKEDK